MLKAASSRMATTADIEVTEGRMINMETVKLLTENVRNWDEMCRKFLQMARQKI